MRGFDGRSRRRTCGLHLADVDMNRTLRSILLSFLGAALLAAAGAAFVVARAGYWLEAPAQAPRRADVIAVLGGDEDGERASRSLALFREGYAPMITLTGLQMTRNAVPAASNWRASPSRRAAYPGPRFVSSWRRGTATPRRSSCLR